LGDRLADPRGAQINFHPSATIFWNIPEYTMTNQCSALTTLHIFWWTGFSGVYSRCKYRVLPFTWLCGYSWNKWVCQSHVEIDYYSVVYFGGISKIFIHSYITKLIHNE
jgi:hypothetical protein